LTSQGPLCHVMHSLWPVIGGKVALKQDRPGLPRCHMAEPKKHEVKLESTLESVDIAEEIVKRFARLSGFSEDEVHQIGMAVRESVVNAVVHGNCYNSQKKVTLAVESTSSGLTIRVQDQGLGFDIADVPDPLAAENLLRKSGRGLFLIRAFMDELRVNRLGAEGMEIVMIKNSSPTSKEEV
jgi:serine/threonine-protein kinase RsbW